MTYDVSGMEHKEMVELVRRRLSKLAMCKRGSVSSDINEMVEKLGPAPTYTASKRLKIKESSVSILRKAMTPTLAMAKKCETASYLANELRLKGEKAVKDMYKHPLLDKYTENVKKLKAQGDTRIGCLDADFQDVEDEYILGVKTISSLPGDLLILEQKEW